MSKFEILNDEIGEENMPRAVGWRVLIQPIDIEEMTDGGIILPGSVIEAKEYLRSVGKVVAMGGLCYKHAKFGDSDPWCKIGDWVVIADYAGQEIKVRNKEGGTTVLKIVNDDEIRSVLPNPEAVMIYV